MTLTSSFPSRLFITGTDTGVGKTMVSAILAAGLKTAYWKPVQSGLDEETDTEAVKRLTGLPDLHFFPETYRLKAPLSPHESARRDGITIDLNRFALPEPSAGISHLIVEGAGGVFVPLNNREFMLDLMKKFALPVLLVSRSTLGTINHTLLSIEALRNHHLTILGVVMNGPKNPSNRAAIEHYGNVKVLGEIEPLENFNSQTLKNMFEKTFEEKLSTEAPRH